MKDYLGLDVPDDARGRPPGHPLGGRLDRLLPHLHARERHVGADLGGGARPISDARLRRSRPASSASFATGFARTSTATAASSLPKETLARVVGGPIDAGAVPLATSSEGRVDLRSQLTRRRSCTGRRPTTLRGRGRSHRLQPEEGARGDAPVRRCLVQARASRPDRARRAERRRQDDASADADRGDRRPRRASSRSKRGRAWRSTISARRAHTDVIAAATTPSPARPGSQPRRSCASSRRRWRAATTGTRHAPALCRSPGAARPRGRVRLARAGVEHAARPRLRRPRPRAAALDVLGR